jgi:hypothetical protein
MVIDRTLDRSYAQDTCLWPASPGQPVPPPSGGGSRAKSRSQRDAYRLIGVPHSGHRPDSLPIRQYPHFAHVFGSGIGGSPVT